MDARSAVVKERILEVVIIVLGVFLVSDTAQSLFYLSPPDSTNDAYMTIMRASNLLQLLFKAGLLCLIVQAAGKKLTDIERERTGGVISWYEPWRIAQAISVFGFILIWAIWVYHQATSRGGGGAAHPGVFVISGLIVLSSLGWPALFRMLEPKGPFEPSDE